MRITLLLAWPVVLASALVSDAPPNADTAPVDALRHAAVPFERGADGIAARAGERVRSLACSARVVGVGESLHHTHELWEARLDLLQSITTSCGAGAVAMETGLAEARLIEGWLRGDDRAAPDWSAVFPYADDGTYEELRELLTWIRDRNTSMPASRQVRFYGIDLSFGGGSLRAPLEGAWRYLDDVDRDYAARSRATLAAPVNAFGDGYSASAPRRYAALPRDDQARLREGVNELRERFAARAARYRDASSAERLDAAARLAEVAHQTLAFIVASQTDPEGPRDRALADNVRWVLAREVHRGPLVVFAHNAHVQKVPIAIPGVTTGGAVVSMGTRLHEALGHGYVSIGTAFDRDERGQAAEAGSVDSALAALGWPRALLDLRGPATAWLQASRPMRFEALYLQLVPAHGFDALLFVDRVSPGRR